VFQGNVGYYQLHGVL